MDIDNSEKLAALEAALRNLPIKEPKGEDGIPLSHAIPAFARQILDQSFCIMPVIIVTTTEELVTTTEGLKQAKVTEELKQAKAPTTAELKQALEIIARIQEHPYVHPNALWNFRVSARIILGTAVGAEPTSKKGRPPKADSAAVTEICGEIFYALTDKKPTAPSGRDSRYSTSTTPFVKFLEEIFGILGLVASAKSCAKVLDDKWREHCSGNEGNNPIKFILNHPRIGD